MPGLDPYNITDKLDDTLLDVISTRLENRGKHPRFVAMLSDYLEAMRIDQASMGLDLGCGTGVAARAIARRPGFGGLVLGIDLSQKLANAATQLAEEEGLGGRVRFEAGDALSLGLEDESFDAVVAHTLLSHVNDPARVLAEARRLLRPGGLLGAFDGDYASLTFEAGDEATAKANDEKLIRGVVTQPRVMRRMPMLARAEGFEIVASFAYVLAEIGQGDFWLPAIESFRRLIPKAGAMDEPEADAWARTLMQASAEGVFFGSSNYYGYVLKRP